jgi:hypothetical protein
MPRRQHLHLPFRSLGHAAKRLVRRMKQGDPTSMSDTRGYRALCDLAASSPDALAVFRSWPGYSGVLEHVEVATGRQALAVALSRHPEYLPLLSEFRRNDSIGSPALKSYDGFGEWSPTTLRYIKILADIEDFFGDLSGMHIVEIGAGYGGQCRLILARFPTVSYTILDLPEAARLAARFVAALGPWRVTLNPPPAELRSRKIDLLISNYALSEVSRPSQDAYFESAVSRSLRGYMLWNASANRPLTTKMLSARDHPCNEGDAVKRIPGATILRGRGALLDSDVSFGNALIVWGHHPAAAGEAPTADRPFGEDRKT